jgi:hypothetical protein
MRIKIYDYTDAEGEIFRCEAWLDEALDNDAEEIAYATNGLSTTGRYWAGGGASPIVLLMRA